MDTEFYKTRMGQQFYQQQIPALIRVLTQASAALERIADSKAVHLDADASPEIIRRLFTGDLDFGRLDRALSTEESEAQNEAVDEAYHVLVDQYGRDCVPALEAYSNALRAREPMDQEQCFVRGFQTAVQFIAAGMTLGQKG